LLAETPILIMRLTLISMRVETKREHQIKRHQPEAALSTHQLPTQKQQVKPKMATGSTTRPFFTPIGTSSSNKYEQVLLQMAMTQPSKQMHKLESCQSSTGPC